MEKFSKWLTPIVALFFSTALAVTAATTIGTNITTTGTFTASTTTAGADITLRASDQFVLSATDINTELSGEYEIQLLEAGAGGFTLQSASGDSLTLFPGSENFNIYIADDGSSNTVEFDCDGDSASCEVNSNGAGGFVQFLTSGTNSSITLNAGGTGADVNITAADQITFNTTGGAVKSADAFAIPAAATLPTCNTTIAPSGYYAYYVDTTGPDLCQCDGSTWSAVDGAGTCS
ncbi:MAG: hypothetical protein AAB458_01060 [Patescibacteria group bacterium]